MLLNMFKQSSKDNKQKNNTFLYEKHSAQKVKKNHDLYHLQDLTSTLLNYRASKENWLQAYET